MQKKTVFPVFLCIAIVLGGLVVPLIGFSTNHIPPVEHGISITVKFGAATEAPAVPTPIPGVLSPEPFKLPPVGTLVLRGFGAPAAFLTVKKNDVVGATARLSLEGTFSITLSSISENTYTISVSAEDDEGFETNTLTFRSIPVFKDAITTLENIFLPPTLSLDTLRVEGTENVSLHGAVPPGARVNVFFSSSRLVKSVLAGQDGRWALSFPARELGRGDWRVKAHAQLPSGLISEFSAEFGLTVLSGPPPPLLPPIPEFPAVPPEVIPPRPLPPEGLAVDVSGDGRIDIIDLSILLYNWGVPKDPRFDFNRDGVVDLVDFSIMLFWWSG